MASVGYGANDRKEWTVEERGVAVCGYTDSAYGAGYASNRVANDLIRRQISKIPVW